MATPSDTETSLRARLLRGDLLVGYSIGIPAPEIAELAGPGWDWVWIDAQHGPFEVRTLAAVIAAATANGVPAVVRPPGHDPAVIAQILDLGAAGLLVPQVESAEQAAAVVRAARFPPHGGRSYGYGRVWSRQGTNFHQAAISDTLVVVQIETPAGVDACAEVAAVPGVDALFFGPVDLKLAYGLPRDAPLDHPRLRAASEKMLAACDQHGVAAGTVGGTPAAVTSLARQGYRLMVSARDQSLLVAGFRAARSDGKPR